MAVILGLLTLIFVGLLIVSPFFFLIGIRIIDQYEDGLVLTFGRYTSLREPGFRWVFPIVQRMIKVDKRIATVDVPRQEVITKDNVTVGVDAVVYFKVKDSSRAVLEIQNFRHATVLYAQAVMRDVVGNEELDTLLSERDRLSEEIKKQVDVETDKWGIDIDSIKVQNIELPQDMKRAMAKQAEAERERRATVINAEGENQAAVKLAEAAKMLATSPGSMNLRTLETLEKVSGDPNQKTVYFLPAELMEIAKKFSS
ncbi:slipin family protein [Candidatus Saccharibacteria bacterium]|nr:slipin family protein [Candidatus Saccharibacteria bacterium]